MSRVFILSIDNKSRCKYSETLKHSNCLFHSFIYLVPRLQGQKRNKYNTCSLVAYHLAGDQNCKPASQQMIRGSMIGVFQQIVGHRGVGSCQVTFAFPAKPFFAFVFLNDTKMPVQRLGRPQRVLGFLVWFGLVYGARECNIFVLNISDQRVSEITHFILTVQYIFLYSQQEDSLFASMPPLCPIGSHPKVQSPKPIAGGLGAFTTVSVFQGIILPVNKVLLHGLFCSMWRGLTLPHNR